MTRPTIIAFILGALIGPPIKSFTHGVVNGIVIGLTGHDTIYHSAALGTALRRVFVKDNAP